MTYAAHTKAAEARAKLNEVVRRAVPVTRMVDYGVPLGDAQTAHSLSSLDEAGGWDDICESLSRKHASLAERAESANRDRTAAEAWRARFALLACAQLAFNDDVPRKKALYELANDAMARHAALSTDVESWSLSTPAGTLYGWAVRPLRPPAKAVLVIGGLSGWGAAYLDMGRALAARGMLAVLAEGPGQGLSRMRHGIVMTPQTLPLLGRFIDRILDTDATRIGVWGNSFGGLFAAHLAAADKRVRAVCINGAPSTPTVPPFRTALEQMAAAFGTPDEAALAERLRSFSMKEKTHRIQGAVLVVQGGRDALVSLGEQDSFLALGSPEKSTTFTWDDGEHTIYNHAQQRNALVADWFEEQLQDGRQA